MNADKSPLETNISTADAHGTVVQQSQAVRNESEMVGGLNSREAVIIPDTSIVFEVCWLYPSDFRQGL